MLLPPRLPPERPPAIVLLGILGRLPLIVLLERVDMLGRFGATLVFVRGAMFGRALGAVFGRAFTLGRFSWPTFGRAFGTGN